jgi:CcmD family protein
MDSRNLLFLFYGFLVAWMVVVVYVVTIVLRERKLSRQMENLRALLESGEKKEPEG